MLGALDSLEEREREEPEPLAARARGRSILAKRSDVFSQVPFAQAVKLFDERRIVSRDVFGTMDDAAKKRAFTVAGLASEELLGDAHAELSRQLKASSGHSWKDPATGKWHYEGPILRDFRKFVKKRLESAGWTPANPSHVETVFRTNIASAYSTGRVAEMTQPSVLKRRPYWQIRTVKDDRQRKTHRAADGAVLPADHPFWRVAFPPFGYNCRCKTVSRSQRWVDKHGGVSAPPTGLPDPGFSSGTDALVVTGDELKGLAQRDEVEVEKRAEAQRKAEAERRRRREQSAEKRARQREDARRTGLAPPAVKPPKPVSQAVARQIAPFRRIEGDKWSPEYQSAAAQQRAQLVSMPTQLEEEAARELVRVTKAKVPVEVAQKHPRVVAALQNLEVTEHSHPGVKRALDHLEQIDPRLLHQIAHTRGETWHGLQIGARSLPELDDLQHLRGVYPRGWPPGSTWDIVGGCGGPQQVAVAVEGISDSAATALHEIGHAVGSRLKVRGISVDQSTELVEHHRRLYGKLPPYLAQDGPGGIAGCEEMFAESVAELHVWSAQLFDELYDQSYRLWLEKTLQALAP